MEVCTKVSRTQERSGCREVGWGGSLGRCERSLGNLINIFQTDKWSGTAVCREALKRGSERAGSVPAFALCCACAHGGLLLFVEYTTMHTALSLYT